MPLISFTVVVDVPEHRQEEIITQIKQLESKRPLTVKHRSNQEQWLPS
jgi:hypothetical protein